MIIGNERIDINFMRPSKQTGFIAIVCNPDVAIGGVDYGDGVPFYGQPIAAPTRFGGMHAVRWCDIVIHSGCPDDAAFPDKVLNCRVGIFHKIFAIVAGREPSKPDNIVFCQRDAGEFHGVVGITMVVWIVVDMHGGKLEF